MESTINIIYNNLSPVHREFLKTLLIIHWGRGEETLFSGKFVCVEIPYRKGEGNSQVLV
jgi:hypothetical protein